MTEHNIVGIEPYRVAPAAITCSCGERFEAPTLDKARVKHREHWGLSMFREALEGGRDG